MKTFEYICTCFAIAGIVYIFTLWQDVPYPYDPWLAPADTQMLCPDLVIKHSVKSNLTTGVEVRDACAESLNIFKY